MINFKFNEINKFRFLLLWGVEEGIQLDDISIVKHIFDCWQVIY